MTAPVRVLIVDDHPMVAEGIEALLETFDDLDVVDRVPTTTIHHRTPGDQPVADGRRPQPLDRRCRRQ